MSMIVKLILPDEEPNVRIESYKFRDGCYGAVETYHSFIGVVLKDWTTIDLTKERGKTIPMKLEYDE